ncbi:class I SAM-dependent methyltransferase, partial [Sulfolobus sp. A20-N-F8]
MHGHFYPPEEFRRKYERPEEFLPSVITNKGVVIVDYGCGNGFYCKYLVQYASKLYCIDVNVIALEEVKRKISNAITLTDSKTIENKSVDYILFANSFHDMEN